MRQRLRRGIRRDVQVAVDHPYGGRIGQRQGPALPGGDTGTSVGDREIATSTHLVVHPPSAMGSQVGVEVALERTNLRGGARIVRVQPPTRGRPGVCLVDDVGRFGQYPIRTDEHRGGPAATCPAHGNPVDELQVRLLLVGDASTIERPASLLAVVTDRDRDQDIWSAGGPQDLIILNRVVTRAIWPQESLLGSPRTPMTRRR